MKHTPTISAEFEDYLKQNDMTLSQFAEYSGFIKERLVIGLLSIVLFPYSSWTKLLWLWICQKAIFTIYT
ncbi:hypothetical protein JDW19_07095 [Paenibacillus polymyxa]|uniref:Uncharacterized protein n=1 Tax=Paenibacillus polymyxa TaxID=1406 RepID=A0A8I1IQZ6_PAEPO|nr:hypothetical protein G9G53_10475 [Paenibacillus sp. EKM206P]KAF6588696.1 hypothetical protein G9G52_11400 [Paenibacillus sp. EKM205P]MBM0632893.1 hypothetical protein [Paenibacillus polymyxa]